jgi:hypothetical protein
MKYVFLFLSLIVFAASARAVEFHETDESYYARLEKTCEHTVRETWRDYLLYAPNPRIDQCCMESIDAIRINGFREAENGQCLGGQQLDMLKCVTTKKWCRSPKAQSR